MSRVENVIFVKNFRDGQQDIEEVLGKYDTILLQAQSEAIEVAISLAEYFVNTEKTLIYKKFTSSLVENQKNQLLPKCSIVLKCQPKAKESNKYVEKQRNDFDSREDKKPKKGYREKDSDEVKNNRDYNRKGR